LRNPTLRKNYIIYEYLAIIYEKNHDFKNADKAFKEGFENKVHNQELLGKKYKLFEERMENRIHREINSSEITQDTINDHLDKELIKRANNLLGDKNKFNIGNKRNHCDMTNNNKILNSKYFYFYNIINV
jgi:hypothetical protein